MTEKKKRSTKEVPPLNSQLNILLVGLNPFHSIRAYIGLI